MSRSPASARDRGVTFVELLVAIVLLGTATVAILAGFRATIIGSAQARDEAAAQVELQSLIERLHAIERIPCDGVTGPAEIRSAYAAGVANLPHNADPESELSESSVKSVALWDGADYGPVCNEDSGYRLQEVQLEVVGDGGKVLASAKVVKGDTGTITSP